MWTNPLTYTIIFGIVSGILGLLNVWQAIVANRLNRQKLELEASVDQIKKFDQPTAMSMFQRARSHEHNTWNFYNSFQKFIQLHRDEDEGLRLLGELGTLRGEADSIVIDMIRVYRLSGAIITEQVVDQWIKDGFIPDHYRNRFLSHIR